MEEIVFQLQTILEMCLMDMLVKVPVLGIIALELAAAGFAYTYDGNCESSVALISH